MGPSPCCGCDSIFWPDSGEEFGAIHPSSQVEDKNLRGLFTQSETRAVSVQTFLIRFLCQLPHLCLVSLEISSKSHVPEGPVCTPLEKQGCEQQGNEGGLVPLGSQTCRDKEKIHKTQEK